MKNCLFVVLCVLSFSLFSQEMNFPNGQNREITFTIGQQTLGNTRTFGIDVADVDQDDDIDIFITDYIGESKLWLNDGYGFFIESNQYFPFQEDHDAEIADLNGDIYPDIFIISHAAPSKVFFNNGDGSFTSGQQNIGTSTDYPGKILLDDVDNDNDIDAFISYYQNPNRLWLNDGNGYFTITDTLFGADGNSGSMELMDFNGDTFPDLFLCMCSGPDQVWLNDGSGNYSNTGQALGSSSGNDYADSKDIDGDGDNDVIVANTVEGIKIWINQSNTGVFAEASDYFADENSRVELFDADLDGDFDLIATHSENGNSLMVNDGSGNFTSIGVIFGYSPVICIVCDDLDGDNDYDVVFGQGENTGGNPIYFNESTSVGVNESIVYPYIQIRNYPNPFNPSTEIRFQISDFSEIGSAAIEIYNLKGQIVKTISINSSTDQLINSVSWNGTDNTNQPVSSGIYYYKLNIPNSPVKKLILMK
jgi:FG-GAP-like repeat/FlgD Ig-like domain